MTAQAGPPLSIARTWRPSSGACAGMRRPTDDEHRLIEASRKARDQQEKTEARNKTVRRVVQIAFAVLFLILAGVTVWASRTQADATLKTAETLTQSGINALEQEHTFEAMHRYARAVFTLSSDAGAQADNRLRLSFLGPGHVPALRSISWARGVGLRSAAFSPDGQRVVTASYDQDGAGLECGRVADADRRR